MIEVRPRAARAAAALSCVVVMLAGCAGTEPAPANEPLGMPESDVLLQPAAADCQPTGNYQYRNVCINGLHFTQQLEEWCCEEDGAVWYMWRVAGPAVPSGMLWGQEFAGTGRSSTIRITDLDGSERSIVAAQVKETYVVWMSQGDALAFPQGDSELQPTDLRATERFDLDPDGGTWDLEQMVLQDGAFALAGETTRVTGHAHDPLDSLTPISNLQQIMTTVEGETLQAVLIEVSAWVTVYGRVHDVLDFTE